MKPNQVVSRADKKTLRQKKRSQNRKSNCSGLRKQKKLSKLALERFREERKQEKSEAEMTIESLEARINGN